MPAELSIKITTHKVIHRVEVIIVAFSVAMYRVGNFLAAILPIQLLLLYQLNMMLHIISQRRSINIFCYPSYIFPDIESCTK